MDIRQEPDHPYTTMLTLPERMLILDLGRAGSFYRYEGRWGAARSERTHAHETLQRLSDLYFVVTKGLVLPNVVLTGEGAWLFRTLMRRAQNGLSQSRTSRVTSQEPGRKVAAEGAAHVVGS